ncbi:hypothetical protein [Kribbella solani]|uniref:Uncharacterized protein n=1 Tax=Kribbella solani TaxID=236067 RepID=A0A841DR27_9ACTN|nr:hypothetical protein [Kribbella solani]MBB5981093.1 hypothetical protein [Kribbella solani]
MSGSPDLTASARENVDFPAPAIPVTMMRRCVSLGYMTPSQVCGGARFDYPKAVRVVVSKLANGHLRHGKFKDAQLASHCCIPAQHATTRP